MAAGTTDGSTRGVLDGTTLSIAPLSHGLTTYLGSNLCGWQTPNTAAWWGWLETMKWHGGNTLFKVAADQLIYGPYIVGTCLALATALKGKHTRACLCAFRRSLGLL